MEEQMLSEDQLRTIIAKAKSEKMRDGAKALLSQMEEIRSRGGVPVCVLEADGLAYVFDNTELMGN